ncbi:hypothetical protein SDC9_42778 [bioreactor metagenome]|uniref:Uncharacterized protein n=1 Tax=bioreactor metagenome TaxID=1076179 RepID=A0A644VZ48_9ZZZZ
MAVGAERGRDVAVAHELLYDPGIDAHLQQHRGVSVPITVEI